LDSTLGGSPRAALPGEKIQPEVDSDQGAGAAGGALTPPAREGRLAAGFPLVRQKMDGQK